MKDGFIKVAAATPVIRVADCRHNAEKILELMTKAEVAGIQILVLPELCLCGYTCGDLFFQQTLLESARDALLYLTQKSAGLEALTFIGLPLSHGGKLYNCAAAIANGRLLGIVPKTNLPNYAEFYERRHFTPAPANTQTLCLGGQDVPFGTNLLFACSEMPTLQVAAEICEDLWVPAPPSVLHASAGATIIVNLSASDETIGKADYRRSLVANQSARLLCAYIYADAGEGESTTDMVFGAHNLIAENGSLLAQSSLFESGFITSEIDVNRLENERRRIGTFPAPQGGTHTVIPFSLSTKSTVLSRPIARFPFVPDDAKNRASRCEEILTIQSLGLKKRLEHTNTARAVLGVSGGLDSTLALLVCARAMDLLGRPRTDVLAITMPCFGTTSRTRSNAEKLCEALGVTFQTVDITKAVLQHFEDIGHDPKKLDVVFENSQARERTQVLMDIANRDNGLVVGTGDLSELALGWATYNGDHMSMYGVNASIPKTLIRHIIGYVAQTSDDAALCQVLEAILATPVSPELLPPKEGEISQITEDLVGPYALHDFFLYYVMRWAFPPKKVFRLATVAFEGEYDHQTILRWLRTFYRRFFSQQFKRSCLPDGPKVGSVTLSPRGDWRMPSDASASAWLAALDDIEKTL